MQHEEAVGQSGERAQNGQRQRDGPRAYPACQQVGHDRKQSSGQSHRRSGYGQRTPKDAEHQRQRIVGARSVKRKEIAVRNLPRKDALRALQHDPFVGIHVGVVPEDAEIEE